MKKDRAAVVFRRSPSGEVIGEIVDESRAGLEKQSFGVMTEEKYRRVLELMEQDNPDVGGMQLIEIMGN